MWLPRLPILLLLVRIGLLQLPSNRLAAGAVWCGTARASQPATQPASQPASQPMHQPARQPMHQPARQPMHQPASQAGSKPARQAGSQPGRQAASQAGRQAARQAARQTGLVPLSLRSRDRLRPRRYPVGDCLSRRATQLPSGRDHKHRCP